MSQSPYQLAHKDAAAINDILSGLVDYHPATLASDWRRRHGNTVEKAPLFDALAVQSMAMGHIRLAEALLMQGARPLRAHHRAWNNDFFVGLYGASEEEPASLAQLLARQGSHVLIGSAPPAHQNRRPRREVLKYLLAHPADWNLGLEQEKYGTTPLVACLAAHSRYWRYAKSRGVIDESETADFMQSLIDAGAQVNPSCERNLLEAAIPDHDPHKTPSFFLLDRVIAWGADTHRFAPHAWARAIANDVDRRYAKNEDYGPRTKALMERGIALYSPPGLVERYCPLAQAFITNMRPALNTLVSQGVDLCWIDPRTGASLLNLAATRPGNLMATLNTLPVGTFQSIVNHPDRDGNTPLHLAVNALNLKAVERFLDEGADLHAKNRKKQKPVQAMRRSGVTAQNKFDDVLDLLLDRGADLGTDTRSSGLHQAASMLSGKAIARLLAQGADPHLPDASNKTPVGLVVQAHQQSAGSYFNSQRGCRQLQALDAFIQAGVDIHRPLPDGSTLLHHAMERCCDLVVVELLARGADIHAKNKDGQLPMHMWNKGYYYQEKTWNARNQPAIIAVVEAFIAAGADMDEMDNDGALPFAPARSLPGVQGAIERAVLDRTTQPTSITIRSRSRL